MCLIMTFIAALIFTVIYALSKKQNKATKSMLITLFMFWSAAIMWSVDGIASVAGGEGFFDISRQDAILGVIIVIAGLAVFAGLSFFEKRRLQKTNA